jgi:hypothetical protein
VCSCAHSITDPTAVPIARHDGHPNGRRCVQQIRGFRSLPPVACCAAVHASGVAHAEAVESVDFQTGSGVPWTWRCASCAPSSCSIVAPNKQPAAPPSSACSGVVQLTLSTSPLSIGDGPGDYMNNANCTWLISASGPITVRFSEFSTEYGYDYVKLYDGASTTAPLLGNFSSTSMPPTVTSTGNALTVLISSDSSTTSAGFTATLTSASTDAPLQLTGTVPAALGNVRCTGSVTVVCVLLPAASSHFINRPAWDAHQCRDLSGQNLTGQLPDSITRLRVLHTMCAAAFIAVTRSGFAAVTAARTSLCRGVAYRE